MIPLLMLCFETLNLTIESCKFTSYDDELEDESNMCLGLEHPLRSLFQTLVIKESTLLGGYPYPSLHVKIFLFCGTTTKDNF